MFHIMSHSVVAMVTGELHLGRGSAEPSAGVYRAPSTNLQTGPGVGAGVERDPPGDP